MYNKQTITTIVLVAIVALLIGHCIGMYRGHEERATAHDMNSMCGMDHSMHGMMGSMTAKLNGKEGSEFDKAFLEEMIVHHEGAVDMAQLVLTQSSRPELKAMAQDIISAQTREIQQMEGWLASWYK